ncbi:MAG: L-threonylcarbamoyladenylate synthase [Pseudomonadota bacterium]
MDTKVLAEDNPDWLAEATDIVRSGSVVALATETVYGLAGDATNPSAVARIYAAKGRPSKNPLIVHVSGVDMATALGHVNERALSLIGQHWPGPLTIVVPMKESSDLVPAVTAGRGSVALRQPRGALAKLIEHSKTALAAPSANASGHVSPTTAGHVLMDLQGEIPLIIDGGKTKFGVESTIVDLRHDTPAILRPGAISAEELGMEEHKPITNDAAPDAPGMLASHYAPKAAVRLNVLADDLKSGETHLGFGDACRPGALNLSPGGDMVEAATNLFGMLRSLDERGATAIAVAPIPSAGLGATINDRLARAAAPRS